MTKPLAFCMLDLDCKEMNLLFGVEEHLYFCEVCEVFVKFANLNVHPKIMQGCLLSTSCDHNK